MDKKTKYQNDPAKFFLFQDKLLTTLEKQKALSYSLQKFNQKSCLLCEKNFDLSFHAPRILVQCGHTLCTSCLYLFFKDQKLKCPFCKKTIKRLRIIEVLPLNHSIYKKLSNLPGMEIDPLNKKLKLPSDLIAEVNENDDTDFPLCDYHDERYKHFFCPKDLRLFCRACVEEGFQSCEHHIVDLYLLKPGLVNSILVRVNKGKLIGF